LLVAEGCCRRTAGQKRQRFAEARGECGEAGAAAEVLAVLGLVDTADARRVHELAGRTSAILFGLLRRLG
jgi:four helix bundle protein